MGSMYEGVICKIVDCGTQASSKEWCKYHYDKWYKYGDPEHSPVPYIKPSARLEYLIESIQIATDDCIVWPYHKDKKGYGSISFGGGSPKRVSRVVCEMVYGPPPNQGMVAAHGPCNNPSCFNPKHLPWADYYQNNGTDRHRDETILIGTKNAAAKLTEEQVMDIRSSYTGKRGEIAAMAKKYGVSKYPIQAILKGKTWKHLL